MCVCILCSYMLLDFCHHGYLFQPVASWIFHFALHDFFLSSPSAEICLGYSGWTFSNLVFHYHGIFQAIKSCISFPKLTCSYWWDSAVLNEWLVNGSIFCKANNKANWTHTFVAQISLPTREKALCRGFLCFEWSGLPLYLILYTHLGYFTRPATSLLRDSKQWLFLSIGFNPDSFINFWGLNALSKIKQQKLSKHLLKRKVRSEKFKSFSSEQFSLNWSVLFAQFLWDRGKYLSCPEKRAELCSDLYCYNTTEESSNGEMHIEVDFLLNVYLLPFVLVLLL